MSSARTPHLHVIAPTLRVKLAVSDIGITLTSPLVTRSYTVVDIHSPNVSINFLSRVYIKWGHQLRL